MIYFSVYLAIGIALIMTLLNLILEIIEEEIGDVKPLSIFIHLVILALIWPITLIAIIKDWLDPGS